MFITLCEFRDIAFHFTFSTLKVFDVMAYVLNSYFAWCPLFHGVCHTEFIYFSILMHLTHK